LGFIDNLSDHSGKIISFFIFISIFVVLWNVITREAFGTYAPWPQATTVGKISLAYVVLGAAYTLRTRSHINVDLLYNRFPPRVKGIIDVITSVLFFLYCTGLLWKSIEFSQYLHLSPKSLLPPYWPTPLLIIIGVSLLILQGLAKLIRDLTTAIKGESF
jgi:TRAP-type mannitol/chloroaromatic compound transport system permease small subunit